jgi:cob(I)alamin adenosyltransferase
MVKLDKIYTKGGDKGKTSLVGGSRVSKSNDIIDAIGNVDELNALLGLAVCDLKKPFISILKNIQNDLFDIGADIATPINKKGTVLRINKNYIVYLEKEIDKINNNLPTLNSFILPGGSKVSSIIHLARTVNRRCERSVVKLNEKQKVNVEVLKYLNRLSDYLFVLARALNKKEVLWKPLRKNIK